MPYFNSLTLSLLFMFFFGGFSFALKKKHILSSLISLELMALAVSAWTAIIPEWSDNYGWFPSILTILVCEGALGLTLLVSSVRSEWQGNFSNTSFLTW